MRSLVFLVAVGCSTPTSKPVVPTTKPAVAPLALGEIRVHPTRDAGGRSFVSVATTGGIEDLEPAPVAILAVKPPTAKALAALVRARLDAKAAAHAAREKLMTDSKAARDRKDQVALAELDKRRPAIDAMDKAAKDARARLLAALDRDGGALTDDGAVLRVILRYLRESDAIDERLEALEASGQPPDPNDPPMELDAAPILALLDAFDAKFPASKLVPIARYLRATVHVKEVRTALLDVADAYPASRITERAYEAGAISLIFDRDPAVHRRVVAANRWLVEHGSSEETKHAAHYRLGLALQSDRDPEALAELCVAAAGPGTYKFDAPQDVSFLLVEDRVLSRVTEACAAKRCPCTQEIVEEAARIAAYQEDDELAIDLYQIAMREFPGSRAKTCSLVELYDRDRKADRAAALRASARCPTPPVAEPREPAAQLGDSGRLSYCAGKTGGIEASATYAMTIGPLGVATALKISASTFSPAMEECADKVLRRHHFTNLDGRELTFTLRVTDTLDE